MPSETPPPRPGAPDGDPHRLLSLQEAAELEGVHYMTVYRRVRTGRLAAVKVGSEWRVEAGDLPARAAPAPRGRRGADRRPSRTETRRRLESRLIEGDEPGAWEVVDGALASGAEPSEVLLDVVAPALDSIGRRWEAGDLSIGEEHRASGVALRLIGRLGPRFARRGRKRGTVVVGAPHGEQHGIPVAMVGDLLRGQGYAVIELGADVPDSSFAEAAQRAERLVCVLVGATTPGRDGSIASAIRAVHDRLPDVPVLVGGAAVDGAAHAARLGARWSGRDGADVVASVGSLPAAS
jgi:excisionase family DNA binding protein